MNTQKARTNLLRSIIKISERVPFNKQFQLAAQQAYTDAGAKISMVKNDDPTPVITVRTREVVCAEKCTNYDIVEMSEPLSKFISHAVQINETVKRIEQRREKNCVTISFKVLTMQRCD